MLKKKKLAVRDAWGSCSEAAVGPQSLGLFFDRVLVLLPVHTIGRIGEHVVKRLSLVGVSGECVAESDLLWIVTGDEHIGFTDAK